VIGAPSHKLPTVCAIWKKFCRIPPNRSLSITNLAKSSKIIPLRVVTGPAASMVSIILPGRSIPLPPDVQSQEDNHEQLHPLGENAEDTHCTDSACRMRVREAA
jgi:hypothetical protein